MDDVVSKKYSKVEDFLDDDDFVRYASEASAAEESFWHGLLSENPNLYSVFKEAKSVIEEPDMGGFTQLDSEMLKQRIWATFSL